MSELLKQIEDPQLASSVREMMSRGANVPCKIAYNIWKDALYRVPQSGTQKVLHVILRGSALSGKDNQGQRIFDGLDESVLKGRGLSVVIHNGILREQEQAVLMLDLLKYSSSNDIISIEIDVPPHVCFARAKKRAEEQCRIDDMDEEAVWKRIHRYHEVAHLIDREVKSRNVPRFLVKNNGNLSADETYNELLRQISILNRLTLPEFQYRLKSYGNVPKPADTHVDWMRVRVSSASCTA
ncbi:MAG TPA: hypothetical protein PJ997_00365 [Candidatus Paceibacterota bacterium]|nr:hypothetical protein [Candidatus Paceibacterota bacterium]HMP18784.1 hypothetical protein [Candidatus Paceibacterota bacterium]HMP85502.1 hypothetical protein [Candidatus Paceibacterota bacterium]